MAKWWSVLFGGTMFACLALFLVAPFCGWWLLPCFSTHGPEIDELFYVILFITGFFFILTEALLTGFMFRYARQADGSPPQLGPSAVAKVLSPLTKILDKPHKIELAWTIIPAAILLWIAITQIDTWQVVKFQSRYAGFRGQKTPTVTEVSARQFEWRMRYPSKKRMTDMLASDGIKSNNEVEKFEKKPQFDDVRDIPNELHAIKDNPVLVYLGTRDVIHSFNIPQLRIKQDALPGKIIKVWFIVNKANTRKVTTKDKEGKEIHRWEDGFNVEKDRPDTQYIWELACAELCGWGHSSMIGRLYVHESEKDFLEWLQYAEDESLSKGP